MSRAARADCHSELFDILERTELTAHSDEQVQRLALLIRKFLIDKVGAAGGHLGSNLGMVEVTLALHRVFRSPHDTLLFDTGHQTYVHKILTGRARSFDQLRKAGGLAGYPQQKESEHDVIENSHASTALAYADGLAKARQLTGETERAVVTVVGDGALTGGMAFEALNNIAAAPQRPVIIVLNDNSRSYAPTVGGLAAHLSRLRLGPPSQPREPAQAAGSLFEHLGLAYLGPVDGHDTSAVEEALRAARTLRRPVIVHVTTVKGRGYEPAERDQDEHMHAIGARPTPGSPPAPAARPSWTALFSETLCTLGARHDNLVAVTAAMPGPTGLSRFQARYPDRFFDVGIAEQHAVASAAGLAMAGLHPVVALYATFLTRALDQVLMDVALHQLPVTFVLDRAGITGPDGPSHHGMWDLSILGAVPGLRIAAPRDAKQLPLLLEEAVSNRSGPTVLRFPKGTTSPDLPRQDSYRTVDVLHTTPNSDVLIVATGILAHSALRAAETLLARGIGTTVVDPRWLLPISPDLLDLVGRHRRVVTVEDNTRSGGFGSALAHLAAVEHPDTSVRSLALPSRFIPHGERHTLLAEAGLDADGIARCVLNSLTPPRYDTAQNS
ncbi:1-deoxy-D-xylulose-5-phosphate synthase [Streptomyces althioticus]|uniref:1-deoxy-D-xylulose-5-phosphate synthase n=1 Tax=Streptomyces althioticus TaxID=83380 RepID=UPI0036D1BDED